MAIVQVQVTIRVASCAHKVDFFQLCTPFNSPTSTLAPVRNNRLGHILIESTFGCLTRQGF